MNKKTVIEIGRQKVTKIENLVCKKWLSFVQAQVQFFANFLFLPTKIFCRLFFTDKVFQYTLQTKSNIDQSPS